MHGVEEGSVVEKEPDGEVESELECRVCRTGPELPLRPLFSPCLCSGSIGLVHQDCLEQWLTHSQKEICELCSAKYMFDPEYSADAPDIIPLHILIFSGLKKILLEVVPFTVRIILAVFLWLVMAPLCTSWMYKIWFRPNVFMGFYTGTIFQKTVIFKDATTGLVLMGVIAISFIVLMSFADFLRFHWIQEPLVNGNGPAAVPVIGGGLPFPPGAAPIPGPGARDGNGAQNRVDLDPNQPDRLRPPAGGGGGGDHPVAVAAVADRGVVPVVVMGMGEPHPHPDPNRSLPLQVGVPGPGLGLGLGGLFPPAAMGVTGAGADDITSVWSDVDSMSDDDEEEQVRKPL